MAVPMIDTHAHIYLEQFDKDRNEMVDRAKSKGIKSIYLPNIDSSTITAMMDCEVAYPNYCYPMMGLHPCSVKENYREELDIVRSWLEKRAFVAIGEIGIDLYWDKTFLEQQKEAFRTQIQWAKEFKLPIVIHARESLEEILEIIEDEKGPELQGIFHCFTGNLEQAKRILACNFLVGIGGVLTYKNAKLEPVFTEIPINSIVLETDAPYLSPVPHRGKRNEPSFIFETAKKLSAVKNLPIEEVINITTSNAKKLLSQE